MPKVSNFRRFRKITSRSDKLDVSQDTMCQISSKLDKKTKTDCSQHTLSKFFSFEPKRDQLICNKKKIIVGNGNENSESSCPESLNKKKQKECVSTETIKKLNLFSLNNAESAYAPDDLSSLTNSVSTRSSMPHPSNSIGDDIIECSEETTITSDCDDYSEEFVLATKEKNHSRIQKRNQSIISDIAIPNSEKKFTPLEMQFLELKNQYSDAVLLVECGYKYRFFGEDAKIASQELNIGCYLAHNFLCASFPTHRLYIHVQRLVNKGYKVGVIKQTETAALKAIGNNKNTLFTRKLHAMYTKSTLIGEEFDSIFSSNDGDGSFSGSGYLVCLCEIPTASKKNDVTISIVAVQPSTGDALYCSFEDTQMRTELESCLLRLNPVEMLLPIALLSDRTENLLKTILDESSSAGNMMRLERMTNEAFEYSHALENVSEFYSSTKDSLEMQEILALPPQVICCLSALIIYLKEFNLDSLLKNLNKLAAVSGFVNCMELNAVTMRNLEMFKNAVNHSEYGTLFWALNYTHTKFGKKLLRSWITKPLKDVMLIEQRLDVITEIMFSESPLFILIEKILLKLPDLERSLCSALYQRCSCLEFLLLVRSLTFVRKELKALSDRVAGEIQTSKLRSIIFEIQDLLDGIDSFSENLDENSARNNNKIMLFINTSKYIAVSDCKQRICEVEKKLSDLQSQIAKVLRLPAFKYSTVSGQKYLIEVRNSIVSLVPSSWIKISATKQFSRFRSPEVETLYTELRQLFEQLQENCEEAWRILLLEFGNNFYKYKKAVLYLAELDCYFSLSKFSKQQGYCRPVFTKKDENVLDIIQGRNSVVEKLIGDQCQYVANDTKLNSEKCCMIITGPNMGGKSSYVRQVATITVLAQIGCYVPAESAKLSVFDAIYTRMGASDDLYHKRSTFMTEMQETSDILSHATSKSLVVLDELGRGTSTHDGMAIAYATLNFLLKEIKCTTLFVTHYPPVAELQEVYPNNIVNNHMTFIVNEQGEESRDDDSLTFLYSLDEGMAENSYGINVANLAGISNNVLTRAKQKSAELENYVSQKRLVKDAMIHLFSSRGSNKEKVEYLQKLCADCNKPKFIL